ncbi:Protein C30G12.2, partial [Aphelenchoides avenae]
MFGAQPVGVGANVLLTGANRGIGLGLVHVLVKAPGVKRIFAGCRKPEQAKELKQLQKSSPALEIIQLDVSDDASIKKAFEHVSQAVGNEGLNLLINNSGILESSGTAIDNADRATYLRHFDVNAVSVAVVTSIFLPLLRKAASAGGPARIANISSTLGSVQLTENCLPLPSGERNVVYGMSK